MGKPHPVRRVAAALGAGRARDRVITLLGGHPARSEQELPAPRGPKGAPSLPPVYVGSTRFSLLLPESRDWRLTRQTGATDPEEYANHLYSEERMGPRCDIFCELAAPIYQRMAERHDYRHLVLYSSVMPERWTDRLREAAQAYPVLQLVECGTTPPAYVELVKSTLASSWPDQSSLVFAFRIDDDDLVSVDFLDQVSGYMSYDHVGWALSFSSGYAGLYEDGRYRGVARRHQLLASIGQGAVGRWDAPGRRMVLTPISNHTKTDRKRTVIMDGRRPVFFQTMHVGQDTATEEGEVLTPEEVRERILRRLARGAGDVKAKDLLRSFPTLEGRVDLDGPTSAGNA